MCRYLHTPLSRTLATFSNIGSRTPNFKLGRSSFIASLPFLPIPGKPRPPSQPSYSPHVPVSEILIIANWTFHVVERQDTDSEVITALIRKTIYQAGHSLQLCSGMAVVSALLCAMVPRCVLRGGQRRWVNFASQYILQLSDGQ